MTDAVLLSFGAAVTFTAFCGAYLFIRAGARRPASHPRVHGAPSSARYSHAERRP